MIGHRLAIATAIGVITEVTAPGGAGAQTLGGGGDLGLPWWRVVGSLLACLIVAFLAAVALRATMQKKGTVFALRNPGRKRWPGLANLFEQSPRRIKVVESVRPSPTLEVCLIAADETEYLIAATSGNLLVLRSNPVRVEEGEA